MRIAGVMLARNEEDILEASIRHNLRQLDALTVVDHASTDATPAILAALAAEGLPIEPVRHEALAYEQSKITTGHARRLLAAGADLCIPLDADEFLRMPSRAAFERTVAAADPAVHLALPWLTYLPDFDAPDIVAGLRRARRKPVEFHDVYKVAVRRTFLDSPGAVVARGNHAVVPEGEPVENPHALVPPDVAAVAHVPVRSVEQYTAKMIVGYLSRLLAGPFAGNASIQFREAYASILGGKPPGRGDLDAIAANYGVPREHWVDPATIAWIEDPFLADVALRHTPQRRPSPLAHLLAFGERVAAEVARTTGGV